MIQGYSSEKGDKKMNSKRKGKRGRRMISMSDSVWIYDHDGLEKGDDSF